jgi:3-phenylpropionate/trans-cinnamate dioxygenase ferredoxin component
LGVAKPSRYEPLTVDVCPVEELPPGSVKIVYAGAVGVGVYNCAGKLYAIEDRCSHDDGPLAEGEWEPELCIAICPRHGARFDITTGSALTLPAYEPVKTFPVRVEDGWVKVEV